MITQGHIQIGYPDKAHNIMTQGIPSIVITIPMCTYTTGILFVMVLYAPVEITPSMNAIVLVLGKTCFISNLTEKCCMPMLLINT